MMICCVCGKEIVINHGSVEMNGAYCDKCIKDVEKQKKTEHKFTDEETLQALDRALHLGDAPIGEYWQVFVSKQTLKDTLDLINRQKEEISYWMDVAANAKAEAVKKFEKGLKKKLIAGGIYPVLVKREIDDLVKEIIGENKDG